MKKYWFLGFLAVSTGATVNAQGKGFKTDKISGVQYRFIKHDKNGTKPADTDFVRITMLWTGKNAKGDADSVYLDSYKKGGDSLGSITIPAKKAFRACLEQGISMMAKGDSAIFHVNGDSLFLKSFHAPADKMPSYINGNTVFTFYIKLISFKTKAQLTAERETEKQKQLQKIQARKGQERGEIVAYLQKSNITAAPDADSIFYLQTTPGTGEHVKEGDSLYVKYTGMFLDGKIFDQSDKGSGDGLFKIFYTRRTPLIQGWLKVLSTMSQGEKVRVLIPSKMAYGARGAGSIQPYTPLIFDMEVTFVKSPPPTEAPPSNK